MTAVERATPTGGAVPGAAPERRWRNAALVLGVAAMLVAAAWYVGGRQGFQSIGAGGTNLRLLPTIGQAAPDFVAPTVDGRLVRLSDLRGQPVWLNFWGSWCPPCRAEFPDLQAAYEGYMRPNGIELLAVSLDELPDAAAGYAARNGGTFPILTDPDRRLTGAAYPIANFPTHVLIDGDGVVRDIVLSPGNEEEIVSRARRLVDPAGGA